MNPPVDTTLERYFLEHTPTIRELRRLNRETLLPWPLAVLDAMIRSGIDIQNREDAVVTMRPVITDDVVDMKLFVSKDDE